MVTVGVCVVQRMRHRETLSIDKRNVETQSVIDEHELPLDMLCIIFIFYRWHDNCGGGVNGLKWER